MSLKIKPSGDALGAEISGVDLTRELDDSTFGEIREAFFRYEVVCFRDQQLSDDDHIRFSARLGELRRMNKLRKNVMLRPEIVVVSNMVDKEGNYIGSYDAGIFWHTDGAHLATPHAVSLLRAIKVPEKDGRTLGPTQYASMTAAYDALSSGMKKRIEGFQALHSILQRDSKSKQAGTKLEEHSEEQKKNVDAVHPVVRIHPVTGRKCLFVSEAYTVRILGMPEDESKELLAELAQHYIKPQFQHTHRWQVHDLVMWDDCSTQHKATFDYALPLERLMYRTTVTRLA